MKRSAIDFFSVLLIIMVGLTQVSAQSDNNIKGSLIYYSDNTLNNLNIANRSERVIRRNIMHSSGGAIKLSKINENTFLYDTDFDNKIYIYNLETDESKQVNTGYFPVAFPGSTKYLFMRSTSVAGPQIYLADLNDGVNSARQMTAELGKPLHDAYPVMISANAAIFAVASNVQYQLYLISLDKHSIVQVPSAQPCVPQLWRSRTGHVLCMNPIEKNIISWT